MGLVLELIKLFNRGKVKKAFTEQNRGKNGEL